MSFKKSQVANLKRREKYVVQRNIEQFKGQNSENCIHTN